jgi:hypothetical protein
MEDLITTQITTFFAYVPTMTSGSVILSQAKNLIPLKADFA